MSTEQNKALVRRSIEEVWNQWNLAKIDEFFDSDYVNHDPINPDIRTREQFKEWIKGLSIGFPKGKYTIDYLIAEGDMVFAFNPYQAQNTGALLGLPATGKEVKYTATGLYRIANGKIVEAWWVYDLFSMLLQLGMIRNPWAPG